MFQFERIYKTNDNNEILYLVSYVILSNDNKTLKFVIIIQDINDNIYDVWQKDFSNSKENIKIELDNIFTLIEQMCIIFQISQDRVILWLNEPLAEDMFTDKLILTYPIHKDLWEKRKTFKICEEMNLYSVDKKKHIEVLWKKLSNNKIYYFLYITQNKTKIKAKLHYFKKGTNIDNLYDEPNIILETFTLTNTEQIEPLLNYLWKRIWTFNHKYYTINNSKIKENDTLNLPKIWFQNNEINLNIKKKK